jgi:SAM-dependent methyltransferase
MTSDILTTESRTTGPVDALKAAHRTMWATGDYPAVAEHIAGDPPARALRAAGVRAGDRVLDVATGSGNAALEAARLGARVTGLDLVPELLDVARDRAAAAGLDIDLVPGDAEAMPFADASFARVLSVFGVQFAPRHDVAADELVRVTAPGGTIGLVNWTPSGVIGRMFTVLGRHLPAPPAFASPPPRWGDEQHVRGLFAGHSVDVTFERGTNPFVFASPDACIDFFAQAYGPTVKARERLTAEGTWDACRDDLRTLFATVNSATDGSFRADAEFLVAAVRKVDR